MFPPSRTLAALGLFTMLLTSGAGAEPAFDATPYLHAQRLVDEGGRHVNLYCVGSGSPTVVLGTDGDDDTSAWRFVQPMVARRTRVCSYDPPGFGFSDPDSGRLDASQAVTDMHAFLASAGVTGPLVLVGYSLSGLYARLYADRYPREVGGMVLVSPNITFQERRFGSVVPALAPMMQIGSFLEQCATAARERAIRPGTRAYDRCVYSPPDPTMPKILLDRIHGEWEGTALWSSFVAEMSEDDRNSEEALHEQRSYGAMPLIVLTTTEDIAALPISATQQATLTKAWLSWQEQVARLSSVGVDFVVPDSTQAIPIDRPSIVVAAIDEVVSQVRYRKRERAY